MTDIHEAIANWLVERRDLFEIRQLPEADCCDCDQCSTDEPSGA